MLLPELYKVRLYHVKYIDRIFDYIAYQRIKSLHNIEVLYEFKF